MSKVFRDPTSGQEIDLPDDATPQEIEMIANKHFPTQKIDPDRGDQPATFTGTLKAMGRQLPDNLPALGGIFGSLGGPIGSIGGASAGSMFKQGLKNIAPSIFGESGGVGNVVKDTLTQGVIPEAIGGLAGVLKSLRGNGLRQTAASLIPESIGLKLAGTKAAQVINKAKGMLAPESSMVETAAENTRNNLSPSAQSLAKGTVAEDLSQIPYTQSQLRTTPPIGKTADKIFSDITEVRNAKLATGDPTIVRQLAQDRILRKNWNFDNGAFNPSNVLNELGKSEDIYKEALGKNYDSFKELMTTAKELKVGEHPDSLISWKETRKVGALGMLPSLFGIPYQVTGLVTLSVDAIRKIAADPQIGQLIIAGMKTPKSSPAAGLLSKAIANSLRGTTLFLQTDEGKEKVTVSQDGQLQVPVPSR